MKYKTYKRLTQAIVDLINSEAKWNKKVQEAFGSDTQIMTDIFNEDISKMVDTISEDMNDMGEWTEYLIYEVLLSENDDLTFETNDKIYKSNTKNIWKMIKEKI